MRIQWETSNQHIIHVARCIFLWVNECVCMSDFRSFCGKFFVARSFGHSFAKLFHGLMLIYDHKCMKLHSLCWVLFWPIGIWPKQKLQSTVLYLKWEKNGRSQRFSRQHCKQKFSLSWLGEFCVCVFSFFHLSKSSFDCWAFFSHKCTTCVYVCICVFVCNTSEQFHYFPENEMQRKEKVTQLKK